MEYLQINQNKLKITLTKEECERYGIKEEGGDFNSLSVRGALADLLAASGAAPEFRREGEKLLVQFFPCVRGGAELFVTRLSSVGERERRAISSSSNISTYKRSRSLFLFDSIDSLSRAAHAMMGSPISDLYRTFGGDYLLDVYDERLGELSSCDILLEFSTRLPSSRAPSSEWDTLLIKDNAIEKLRENINNY